MGTNNKIVVTDTQNTNRSDLFGKMVVGVVRVDLYSTNQYIICATTYTDECGEASFNNLVDGYYHVFATVGGRFFGASIYIGGNRVFTPELKRNKLKQLFLDLYGSKKHSVDQDKNFYCEKSLAKFNYCNAACHNNKDRNSAGKKMCAKNRAEIEIVKFLLL